MAVVSFRLAVAQMEPVLGDVAANVDRIADLIDEAADLAADLVVFPEAAVTGYDDRVFRGRLPELADTDWLTPVRRAVDRTGTIAVVNSAIQRDGFRTLTDVVVAPGADALPTYDKQYLYDSERSIFTPGTHGASFTVNDLEVALSVCYDANFPEHAAAAASSGAQIYVNSGAYFPGGAHRRDLHYAARALDNGMFVAFSGLIGGPHGFIGGSSVFDPLGRRIALVGSNEHLAFADLDSRTVSTARDAQRMWAHRRDDQGPHRAMGELAPGGA